MFHIRPYLGSGGVKNVQDRNSIYACPSHFTFHTLAGDYVDHYLLPTNYPTTAWGLQTVNGVYRYYLSYAINEHLVDGVIPGLEGPQLSQWEDVAKNYMFLEGTRSELEGDEIIRRMLRNIPNAQRDGRWIPDAWEGLSWPHSGGFNAAFVDGHVKWNKIAVRPNGSAVRVDQWQSWVTPPGSQSGGDDRLNPARNDCGPWTATASDDFDCPR